MHEIGLIACPYETQDPFAGLGFVVNAYGRWQPPGQDQMLPGMSRYDRMPVVQENY